MSNMELTTCQLRKLQMVELELLCEVDRICKKNKIKYTLYAGTQLGAVRHKGFIPWDDDADVAFTPEEYEHFFEACKKDLDSDKFFLQDYRTDEFYRWGYAKLRRNNSAFIRKGQEHMKYHNGICIDIFVLYNVPDSYLLRKMYFGAFWTIRKALYSEVGKESEKNLLKKVAYKIINKISKENIFKIAEKIRYKKTSQLRHIIYMPMPNTKNGIPSDCMDEFIDMKFEGYTFNGMKNYDQILKLAYKDYMQLPPLEMRTSHNPASKIVFPDGEVIIE
ncbi:LicD family protein [Dorea formicigenerans]|jgi:lipopolysaccharide cholinephosphotransferase|uniref:LicD family protein n=1 Tax=Dorea formicigenerans TaxID=39486 RepID=UPI001D00B1BC|nr:LicD family protein [Dorea formicigenerans]MCB5501245.1 LicD family protein [Dorea formicigenerans]